MKIRVCGKGVLTSLRNLLSRIVMLFSSNWVYFIVVSLLTFACYRLQILRFFKERRPQISAAPE